MANYPQLDDQVGVWKLKDVNSAVMGGYWRTVGSRALSMGGNESNTIDFITMASTGNAVNFGDMLEIWSKKQIKATPHRVIGGNKERFSIPFFFNPQYDTVISEDKNILAGEYLSQRYNSTYIHKIIK